MDRETKTIVTPAGIEVVLKAYLTGREKRSIDSAAIPTSVDYNTEDNGVKGINPQKIIEAKEDAMLNNVIVSISGETSDLANKVLSMKSDEFAFIVSAVKEIAGGLGEKKTI